MGGRSGRPSAGRGGRLRRWRSAGKQRAAAEATAERRRCSSGRDWYGGSTGQTPLHSPGGGGSGGGRRPPRGERGGPGPAGLLPPRPRSVLPRAGARGARRGRAAGAWREAGPPLAAVGGPATRPGGDLIDGLRAGTGWEAPWPSDPGTRGQDGGNFGGVAVWVARCGASHK